jgi:carbon monoxide dehydrogenase subunit G
MKLQYNGEEHIPVGPPSVWAFVSDPNKVARCLPDVTEVHVKDPTHVEAVVGVAVGPVRGKFKLQVELNPDRAKQRIEMKVTGGGFGSAVDLTAGADVVPAGEAATILKWTGEAEVRGPVAAVGSRVLEAQAHKLITQAFANIRQEVSTMQSTATPDAKGQSA